MKNKSLSLLAVTILFLLSACGTSASITEEPISPSPETNDTVVADSDGIKITYTGIEMTQYLPNQPEAYMLSVELMIDNASDVDIVVYPEDASVNGVTKVAVSGMPLTALSGKKAVASFSFTDFEGTDIGSVDDINKVKEIDFRLSVKNNDSFDEIFKTDAISINP